MTPDPVLERVGLRSRDDARAATTELLALEDPPTAIFAARNVICEGAVMALQQQRLSSQVALIGFDEVSVAEMVDPAISVIRQDTYEIGTRAIDLLLARSTVMTRPSAWRWCPAPSWPEGPARSRWPRPRHTGRS